MADRLTDNQVKAIEAPAAGNRITYDGDVKGFGVRVTSAGARAFILNYRARGGTGAAHHDRQLSRLVRQGGADRGGGTQEAGRSG